MLIGHTLERREQKEIDNIWKEYTQKINTLTLTPVEETEKNIV